MIGLGGRLTPVVRFLLVANVAVFAIQIFAGWHFIRWFGLVPYLAARGHIWQLVTYMFLHGGMFHLLFNMLALWIFGGDVEGRMGSRAFVRYYLFTGVGAGFCALAFGWGQATPVVGASGAIFGILLAFGFFFPYRPVTLLIFFVLPVTMSARALVVVFGGVELLTLMQSGGKGLGTLAHLGGLLFGWLYLRGVGGLLPRAVRLRPRGAERRLRTFDRVERERAALQGEVDALLDKISREGMGGLTEGERRRLYEASEQLKRL